MEAVIVYKNLIKMVAYRGGTLVAIKGDKITGPTDALDDTTVKQLLNSHEYVIITATRDISDIRGEALIIVYLVAPGSKYIMYSGDFKNMLSIGNKIITDIKREIVVVSETVAKSHVAKIAAKSPTRPQMCTYDIFKIDLFKHISTPQQSIVPEQYANEICDFYCLDKGDFPKIKSHDPAAVWLGAKAGMIIQAICRTDTIGEYIVWALCEDDKINDDIVDD